MTLFKLALPLIFGAHFAAAEGMKIVEGNYKIDPSHSKIGFEISHLVIATVDGKFTDFEGMIAVDSKLEKSKVDFNIKAASISTSNEDRDKHLKSPDFFDTAKFEKISFKSKKVTGSPDALKIAGELTMHGVTKPVTLEAKYTGAVKDPWGNERIAFKAQTKLNRKDFGLTWNKAVEAGPVVGEEVSIDIRLEAIKEKAAGK